MAIVTEEFGRGLVFPFQRDGQGDFRNASGIPLLRNDIEHLLGIQGPGADGAGELPWDGDVGSRLRSLKHRMAYAELASAEAQVIVSDVLRRYERRIRVGRTFVRAEEGTTGTKRFIEVQWTPVGNRTGAVEAARVDVE